MSMPPKERITLTIDPGVLARIDAVARAREESRSAAVERMLRNGVENEEEMLEMIGQGIEGRIIAHLLRSPHTLKKLAKAVGEELTPEKLARIQADGPGVVEAGRRYRATKASDEDGGIQ